MAHAQFLFVAQYMASRTLVRPVEIGVEQKRSHQLPLQ